MNQSPAGCPTSRFLSGKRWSNEMNSEVGRKKSGPKVVTLNRHSQPRLPGSVVGEPSMRSTLNSGKITEVSDPKFLRPEVRNSQ